MATKWNKRVRILGLMTGTSADGLDLCLVEYAGNHSSPDFKILGSYEIPYPAHFKSAFENPLQLSAEMIRTLDSALGIWYADNIQNLNLQFDLIASHGQTIRHEPPHFTLQIGKPEFMADRFGVPVVYNFRQADIKLGGQGAPLIPKVDEYLYSKEEENIACLNIGGIANISIIPERKSRLPVIAWDTGPGNTLIDRAVRHYTHEEQAFDRGGSIAASGNIDHKLLDFLLEHEFYAKSFPKSAGQEQFGRTYFEKIISRYKPSSDSKFKDLISTLTNLSAKTIAQSISTLGANYHFKVLKISGGGVKNKTLMFYLKKELPHIEIKAIDFQGVTPDNKEAFGFSYLGYLHLRGYPGNIPSVTGATSSTILGEVQHPTVLS